MAWAGTCRATVEPQVFTRTTLLLVAQPKRQIYANSNVASRAAATPTPHLLPARELRTGVPSVQLCLVDPTIASVLRLPLPYGRDLPVIHPLQPERLFPTSPALVSLRLPSR